MEIIKGKLVVVVSFFSFSQKIYLKESNAYSFRNQIHFSWQCTQLVHCTFVHEVKWAFLPLHFNIIQSYRTSSQSLPFYPDPVGVYIKKLKFLNYFATLLRHFEKTGEFFRFLLWKDNTWNMFIGAFLVRFLIKVM